MAAVVSKLEMGNLNEKKMPNFLTVTFTSGEEVVYHRIGEKLDSTSIINQVMRKKYKISDEKECEKYTESITDKFQLLDMQYKSVLEDAERLYTQSNKAVSGMKTSILKEKESGWLQKILHKEG